MVKKPDDDIFGETAATPVAAAKAAVPVTETPEFIEALAKIKADLENTVKTALANTAKAESGGIPSSVVELFQGLALNIAEMSHQGDKRTRPLDPRVVAERAAAQERLNALLLETRKTVYDTRIKAYPTEDVRQAAIRAVSPKYVAISKLYLGDRMIEPFWRDDATKRYWLDEPNDAMRPANPLAEKLMLEFRLSRGSRTDDERKFSRTKAPWITDRGLIIEGSAAPARRDIEAQTPLRDEALDIPTYRDPEAPYINVLGTIADPAMQNYQGKTP
jgi:hypothetical protein